MLENDRHGKGMILKPDGTIVYASFIHNQIHRQALFIDPTTGSTSSIDYRFGVPLDTLRELRDQ